MMLWCSAPRRINHETAAISVGWEPLMILSEGNAETEVRIFLCASGNLEEGDICPGSVAGTRKDNTPVAVKVIPSNMLNEVAEEKLKLEVSILSKFACGHPNILDFLGHVRAVPGYHILESEALFAGPLSRHLRANTKLPFRQALFYCAEIASAIEHLQLRSIVHRDIKGSNVVLNHKGHAVLIDFGCSKNLALEEDGAHQRSDIRTHTFCGTPHVMAPEMVKQSGHGCMVDWWALGVLLWELLCGESPFGYSSHSDDVQSKCVWALILKGLPKGQPNVDFFQFHQKGMDEHNAILIADFIERLLVIDPQSRFGSVVGEVLAHGVWREVIIKQGPVIPSLIEAEEKELTVPDQGRKSVLTPINFLKLMIQPPEFNKQLGAMEYAPAATEEPETPPVSVNKSN